MLILLLKTPSCNAGNAGWGFFACEIAHPSNCTLIGLFSKNFCLDIHGSFDCHHNNACHIPTADCACDGKGIAELEGLFTFPVGCDYMGEKGGWYHFDNGTLVRAKNLKACKAVSRNCFGVGVPNFEQGFQRQ